MGTSASSDSARRGSGRVFASRHGSGRAPIALCAATRLRFGSTEFVQMGSWTGLLSISSWSRCRLPHSRHGCGAAVCIRSPRPSGRTRAKPSCFSPMARTPISGTGTRRAPPGRDLPGYGVRRGKGRRERDLCDRGDGTGDRSAQSIRPVSGVTALGRAEHGFSSRSARLPVPADGPGSWSGCGRGRSWL